MLAVLACPFCGGSLTFDRRDSTQPITGAAANGILNCSCNAYPVAAGIPYFRNDAAAASALDAVGHGRGDDALLALLHLPEERHAAFIDLTTNEAGTARAALALLAPGLEGSYLLFRFSDPTFLAGDAVVRAVAATLPADDDRPVLDLCGGAGHLTRSLADASRRRTFLADADFGKLWLATRYVAPEATVVCCDANEPLPFRRRAFSFVVCSDAFHYIWRRRRLADEIVRLVGDDGAAVLPHLHNAAVWNDSQGMPLSPEAYRALFAPLPADAYRETDLLQARLTAAPIDLSPAAAARDLGEQHALVLLVGGRADLRRAHAPSSEPRVTGRSRVNPLYAAEERIDGTLALTRRFPSDHYEAEYAAAKQYLPERVDLDAADRDALAQGRPTPRLRDLAARHVLLEVPERYL